MNQDRDILTVIVAIVLLSALALGFGAIKEQWRQQAPEMVSGPPPAYDDRGRALAQKCAACHDLTSARAVRPSGPPLWGVVDALAGGSRYAHSRAFRDVTGAECLIWSRDNLDRYLRNPNEVLPGGASGFAGLSNPEERAALLDYLMTLRDEPSPVDRSLAPDNYDTVYKSLRDKRGRLGKEWRLVGKREAQKCQGCHDLSRKSRELLAPPLWRMVGRAAGKARGFCYSPAFQAELKHRGGWRWDERELYRFLYNPQGSMPGTRMLFRGVRDDAARMALIAYLKTLR
ncbi:c-type cytochrome [Magnetofaba australis]|uniref:c-type cytochrome n=1 Tax=Magnetofaba australis TaxID=1472297 RepID=UPI000A19E344|nr:c-type cytochrome [Magnetofaba australis]